MCDPDIVLAPAERAASGSFAQTLDLLVRVALWWCKRALRKPWQRLAARK